jgi:hypothetical protein
VRSTPLAGPFIEEPRGRRPAKASGQAAQNLNCPSPLNSKAHGEELKRKWKEGKKERGENVAGLPLCLAARMTNTLKSPPPPTFVPHSNLSPRCSTNQPKAKDTFSFSFFKVLFISFQFFIFEKCKFCKIKYAMEKEKNEKLVDFQRERENKNANAEEGRKIGYELTISLFSR